MIDPPLWTGSQLEADRLNAIRLFRKERTEEPLEDYLEGSDEYQGYIESCSKRRSTCRASIARRSKF